MMLVNVNGDWQTWPDETPRTLPWDATLSQNPGAAFAQSRGCPAGYFAQLGSDDAWVCRLMESTIVNDGGKTLAEEVGPGGMDAAIIAVADAIKAPVDAVKSIMPSLGMGFGLILGIAALALALYGDFFKRSR